MIKLIESKNDITASEDNPFGCKIRSVAEAYGIEEAFAQFWVQDGGSSLAKLDDTAVLEDRESDWDELAGFLRMLDVKTVSCSEKAAGCLGFPVSSRGEIMLLRGTADKNHSSEAERNPGPREIYALLCAARSDTFVPPEFEPFYMDLSYRTRHGAAMSIGIRSGGVLVACALCSSMTERAAVLSAVAVLPQFRHKGFGRSAVTALTGLLNRERIFLLRADGANEEFYRSMGFVPSGRWAEIHF
ncbi:GNAT family N-acetyltransferase [Caproiciproducens sp. NJN-50]|uniref:GNAT family N-acetyltransferase n=1 Tax=Acutalibacteraceae TaxID=3082771 RepID=UPI000FFE259B|nr:MULTISPECIES: GNAT family N-acetyltransferase [Acutalibacteraceae]QAT48540.1 GNAT family N-acetyltransferase [Caproiciproducens sp. NJN-50]